MMDLSGTAFVPVGHLIGRSTIKNDGSEWDSFRTSGTSEALPFTCGVPSFCCLVCVVNYSMCAYLCVRFSVARGLRVCLAWAPCFCCAYPVFSCISNAPYRYVSCFCVLSVVVLWLGLFLGRALVLFLLSCACSSLFFRACVAQCACVCVLFCLLRCHVCLLRFFLSAFDVFVVLVLRVRFTSRRTSDWPFNKKI